LFANSALPCFTTFLAETRTAQSGTSVSAELKDLALGALSLCDARITINPPTATDEVRDNHVLTIHVDEANPMTGMQFVPVANQDVVVSVKNSNGANVSFNDAIDSDGDGIATNDTVVTTDAMGNAQVTINSSAAGVTTITAKD